MTYERIGMFIAPLAIFAYRFLYPEARLTACIFFYYMADNVLILQILFSRTLAMLLIQLFGLPDQETILCINFEKTKNPVGRRNVDKYRVLSYFLIWADVAQITHLATN